MAYKMLASASIAAGVSAAAAVDRSAAGVPNMNGEYVISKTPGAGDAEFNTKWSECASPPAAVPRFVHTFCSTATPLMTF